MRRLLIAIFILTFTVITSPGFAAIMNARAPQQAASLVVLVGCHADADAECAVSPTIAAAGDSLPSDGPCDDTPGNQNLNEEHSHSQDLVDCGDSAPWLHLPGIARLAGDKLHEYASPHFPIATPPAN